eukprot:6466164-Amphidinium_carterae.1
MHSADEGSQTSWILPSTYTATSQTSDHAAQSALENHHHGLPDMQHQQSPDQGARYFMDDGWHPDSQVPWPDYDHQSSVNAMRLHQWQHSAWPAGQRIFDEQNYAPPAPLGSPGLPRSASAGQFVAAAFRRTPSPSPVTRGRQPRARQPQVDLGRIHRSSSPQPSQSTPLLGASSNAASAPFASASAAQPHGHAQQDHVSSPQQQQLLTSIRDIIISRQQRLAQRRRPTTTDVSQVPPAADLTSAAAQDLEAQGDSLPTEPPSPQNNLVGSEVPLHYDGDEATCTLCLQPFATQERVCRL